MRGISIGTVVVALTSACEFGPLPAIAHAGGSLEPRAAIYLPVGLGDYSGTVPSPSMNDLYGGYLFGYGACGRWIQKPDPEHLGVWSLDYGAHYFSTGSGKPASYIDDQGNARYRGLLPVVDVDQSSITNPSLSLELLPFHLTARYYWLPASWISPYAGVGAELMYLREELDGQVPSSTAPPYALERYPKSTLLLGPQVHVGLTLFPSQVITFSVEARYSHHGEQVSVYDPFSLFYQYKNNTYGGLAVTFGASLYLPTSSMGAAFGGEPAELVIDTFSLARDERSFSFTVSCLATDYAVYIESITVAPAGSEGEQQAQGIACRPGQRYTLHWRAEHRPDVGTYVGTVRYQYGVADGYDSDGKPIWQSPPKTETVTATTTIY